MLCDNVIMRVDVFECFSQIYSFSLAFTFRFYYEYFVLEFSFFSMFGLLFSWNFVSTFFCFYLVDHCWLFSYRFGQFVFLNDRFLFRLSFNSFIQYFVLTFSEMEHFVILSESIIIHWYSIDLMYPIFLSHFYQKIFDFLLYYSIMNLPLFSW